jgi:cytidyltransferase-like protein
MKIVITSGYFNPLHKGHIAYLKAAKELGDQLFVIINSDQQVKKKGSTPFMDQMERAYIVASLRGIDEIWIAEDEDRTVSQTIADIKRSYKEDEIIFANGGDVERCPEEDICKELKIKVVYGVGGEKIQSSSKLIKDAQQGNTKK